LDKKNFPFIVLEAKKEEINPLAAKEKARKYAPFIILSSFRDLIDNKQPVQL